MSEVPNAKAACLIYDGNCEMCQNFVAGTKANPRTSSFLFTPNSGALPPGVSLGEAQSQLVATDERGMVYKNASAVAFVLGRKYRAPWLVTLASLPILKNILAFVYKLVASQRHYIYGAAAPLWWSKLIIILGFWASILLSWHLWVGERYLPRVPVFDFTWVGSVAQNVEYVLFGLLLIFSFSILLVPKRWPLIGLVSVLFVYVCFDLDRLQPWAFLYLIFLSLIALYPWPDYKASAASIVRSFQIALAGVYFWSGVNKINPEFFTRIGPWFVAPLQNFVGGFASFLPLLVWAIPFIEMLVGAILIWPRFERYGKYSAIAMHLFILFIIGPFNYNQNSVVWPWNIVMIGLLLILFKAKPLESTVESKKYLLFLIFVIFWLFPILRFVGLADAFMSATLYSGSATTAVVSFSPNTILPAALKNAEVPGLPNEVLVSLGGVSQSEVNAPAYPEPRVFKKFFAVFCQRLGNPPSAKLLIHPQPDFSNPPKVLEYRCSDFSS